MPCRPTSSCEIDSNDEANAVTDALRAAIADGFDGVVIIGWKGEEVTVSGSGAADLVRTIGAIELAKAEMLAD